MGDLTRGQYCAAFALTHPGVTYTCDPSFNASQLGLVTRWTPVKNLTFSAETMQFAGFSTFSPAAPQPVQAWTFHDQSTLSFNVRVQRNF